MHIVVLDGYTLNPGDNPWDALARFGTYTVHQRLAPREIVAHSQEADVLVTNKCPISADTIAQLDHLKFIAVTATGHNVVDGIAARHRGIDVSNVPEYGTDIVAQFTWALILELCHHVAQHASSVSSGDWTRCPDFSYWLTPQIELAGKCLGLVGHGRIGRRVGTIGQAFGMSVVASGRSRHRAPTGAAVEWLSTDEVFEVADIVSLHCPLSAETDRLVNSRLLERMRPESLLINTSRGSLVDEHDLAAALRSNQIAGAAVDVVSHEPIRSDNPLLTAPNCLITPHMAWTSLMARERLMRTTIENIACFLAGKPQNVVN